MQCHCADWSFFSVHLSVTSLYDYVFPENGLVAYKNGELVHKQVSLFKVVLSCLGVYF